MRLFRLLSLLLALAPVVGLAAAAMAARGGDIPPDDGSVGRPAAGVCRPEFPDCTDSIAMPPPPSHDTGGAGAGGAADARRTRADAEALLGHAETDLDPAVRIARRGEELYMLTEDYVPGRFTVELDADAGGTYRVVKVVLESDDGPIVVTA